MRIRFCAPLRIGDTDHLEQGHGPLPTRILPQVLVDIQHFSQSDHLL